jgi:hypothetical protein
MNLLILSDGQPTSTPDATVIDTVDGSTVSQLTGRPFGEQAARSGSSGNVAILVNTGSPSFVVTDITIYDDALASVIATNTSLVIVDHDFNAPIAWGETRGFYIAQVDVNQVNPTVVRTLSDDGVVGPDSWTLDNSLGVTCMGVSPDETILYYSQGSFGNPAGAIYRWDLVNDVALSDLVAKPLNQTLGSDILIVASDGSIVTPWRVALDENWEARRYSPAGALLNTYPIGTSYTPGPSPPRLALDEDGTSVWAMTFTTNEIVPETSTFQQFDLDTETLLTAFAIPNAASGDLTRPAQSCPLLPFFAGSGGGSVPDGTFGVIGPILWWRFALSTAMSTVAYKYFSDIDDQAPGNYYGGFKDGRILTAGAGERRLSHHTTGDWTGSTFPLTASDHDRFFRQLLVSSTDRYFLNEPQQIQMTSRARRAVLGTAYTVFVGLATIRPTSKLQVDVELVDIVSQRLLSDQAQVPWRKVGDGFIDSELTSISESLDRDTPEPIIYGKHIRIPESGSPGVDVPSPEGFVIAPTYLGIMPVAADAYHVWLIAGHACEDIPFIRIDDGATGTEGSDWLIPHHAGHDGQFGASYVDFRSTTYGNMRRYTLLFGKVTDMFADPDAMTDPDACASGNKQLTVGVHGIETLGTGLGTLLIDRFDHYEDFLVNHVANAGPDSYQSGPRLTNPTWDLFDGAVDIVKSSAFAACKAIAQGRLPSVGSPALQSGYIGAAIIGARSGERESVTHWIAEWNKSCGVRFGINHFGQMMVTMLHPTQAIKDAAPLYEDVNEIIQDSFQTDLQWREQANRVPFKTDLNHATGVYVTTDVAVDDDSVAKYGRVIEGEERTYQFAPGITMAYHLALMEVRQLKDPQRIITLEATVGPEANGDSLGYRDLGDYIRFKHFDEVGSTAFQIRLGWIVRHQVQAGSRKVLVDVLDCDDLIGFDDPPVASVTPETLNDTCANAIDMGDLSTPYDETFDTTLNMTDSSETGFGGSGIAYHAAWFKMTGNIYDGVATFSTLGSAYDTQLVVYSGSCGALVPQGFNDNFGVLNTSALDVDIVGGTDYFILVCGFGPDDGGDLQFRAVFTPNP